MAIDPKMIGIVALAATTVGVLGYAFFYNSIEQDKKTSQRMKSLQVDAKTKKKIQTKRVDEKQRRKAREETLKSVDSQRASGKKAAKPGLAVQMTQAGMTLGVKKFYAISAVIAIIAFAATLIFAKQDMLISLGAGVALGIGLPRWIVASKRKKRIAAFTRIFPNAIDIIIRGVRSGLPLNDCLRIIANDTEEPLKGEFRKLVEATQMGITVPDACERLYEAVPSAETNFFAIVIAIQSTAGGNLSEALANLSNVLRERKKMADKIQAVSMEAKASAGIIGCLPFAVGILIWITSPGYMDPLFFSDSGKKVLLFCAVSMAVGIGIMKKMINFKF